MIEAVVRYCRAVGRRIELPRSTRKQLLEGLRQDIGESYPAGASVQTLTDRIGKPEEVAQSLMDSVDAGQAAGYRMRKRRRIRAIIVTLALLLAAAIGLFIYAVTYVPVTVSETTVVYENADAMQHGEGLVYAD